MQLNTPLLIVLSMVMPITLGYPHDLDPSISDTVGPVEQFEFKLRMFSDHRVVCPKCMDENLKIHSKEFLTCAEECTKNHNPGTFDSDWEAYKGQANAKYQELIEKEKPGLISWCRNNPKNCEIPTIG